jgi:altronate dehydratase
MSQAGIIMPRCFVIDPADNVATMLDDAAEGMDLTILGKCGVGTLSAAEAVTLGHKVALMDIAAGSAIIKYGVAIGAAGAAIQRGQWVHLHNCTSNFDQRSGTLDLHTGAATDTRYE